MESTSQSSTDTTTTMSQTTETTVQTQQPTQTPATQQQEVEVKVLSEINAKDVNDTKEVKATPQSFNLTLEAIPFNSKYPIISSSLGQLIRGAQEMMTRIAQNQETNDYQRSLYPEARSICQGVVEQGKLLLQATTQKEANVVTFNIVGYNGRVKKIRGHYPFVARLRPSTSHQFANFGDLVKVMKQRCEYIVERSIPQRYLDDKEEGEAFTKLRASVSTFLSYLKNTVDNRWSDAVSKARNAGGQVVQQNLERRQQAPVQVQQQVATSVPVVQLPQVSCQQVESKVDQDGFQQQRGQNRHRGVFRGGRGHGGRGRGRGGQARGRGRGTAQQSGTYRARSDNL